MQGLSQNKSDPSSAVQSRFLAPASDTARGAVNKHFVSTSRDHVVDVMRRLAGALPDTVLEDAKQPLVVALDGGINAGKSLIPYVFREVLFEGAAQDLKGRKEFDEIWTAQTPSGQQREVGFVNLVWPWMVYSESLKQDYPAGRKPQPQDVAEAFFEKRQAGGVTFVSHANRGDIASGVHISVVKNGILRDLEKENSLKDKFIEVACKHSNGPWLRRIKIEVSDPRLLADKAFMQAVSDIEDLYDHSAPESKAPAVSATRAKARPGL